MTRFSLGQRVSVRSCLCRDMLTIVQFAKPRHGRVMRLRRCDSGAWVALDERTTYAVHPFPPGNTREAYVLTSPELCTEIKKESRP
jgi:hypothetical protein